VIVRRTPTGSVYGLLHAHHRLGGALASGGDGRGRRAVAPVAPIGCRQADRAEPFRRMRVVGMPAASPHPPACGREARSCAWPRLFFLASCGTALPCVSCYSAARRANAPVTGVPARRQHLFVSDRRAVPTDLSALDSRALLFSVRRVIATGDGVTKRPSRASAGYW